MSTHSDRKLKVGISVYLHKDQPPSVWSSGAWQNIIYFYMLLQQSSRISEVVLANCVPPQDQMRTLEVTDQFHIPTMDLQEAINTVDVMIVMGMQINQDNINALHARGAKVVAFNVGNTHIMVMENIIFQLDRGNGGIDNTTVDAIWTLPHHEKMCRSLFEVCWRTQVEVMPYLWDPLFLQQKITQDKLDYEYKPQRENRAAGKKRLVIFEPNLNVVKTSLTPMMIADLVYRKHPESIEMVHICSTDRFVSQSTFLSFAWALDITRKGVASYEARFDTPSFMHHYGDIVVSHQWENEINNLYYDLLYGGYPWVHNSPRFKDVGYYYPDFDAQAGAQALEQALFHHDAQIEDYTAKGKIKIQEVSPSNPDNAKAYEDKLFALFD